MSTEKQDASVAELVDAIDSKSVASNGVLVQVRPEVPNLTTVPKRGGFFYSPFIFAEVALFFSSKQELNHL